MSGRARSRGGRVWLLLAVALLLLAAAPALGSGGLDITWWTVDGGGGPAAGGAYTLDATAGQPDAGAMAGGPYALAGGYWGAAAQPAPRYNVLLPLVIRRGTTELACCQRTRGED